MGTYMRKMALNGYVLHVDLSPVRSWCRSSGGAPTTNQVAIQANTYGGIYPEEIKALQRDYESCGGPCPISWKSPLRHCAALICRGAAPWLFPGSTSDTLSRGGPKK